MMDEQNELLIHKCVDGELDTPTQQQLLANLDHLMDGWKVLALAYVEEQSWSGCFRDENTAAAASELQFTADNAAVNSAATTPASYPTPAGTARSAGSVAVTRITCLAIALVGGILIGDIWSDRVPAGNSGPTGIAKNSQAKGSAAMPSGNPLQGSKPYELQLPGGEGRSLNIPAYRADLVDHGPDLLPSDSVTQELRKLGYQFEDDRGAIVIELENGEKVLMPLQSLRIAPSGQ